MFALKDFEPRLYQQTIAAKALNANTLVVLPTGLGKTAVALMMALKRLKDYPSGKVIILAPTKPLVHQHIKTFTERSTIPPDAMAVFTGEIAAEKRIPLFKERSIIFSTPQSLENDLLSGKISLEDVVLIVLDEAHRASGEYSYVWLAQQYNEKAHHPLLLALTASPGSELEKIKEICTKLGVTQIEQRNLESPDVKPYIQPTKVRWIEVELDAKIKELLALIKTPLANRTEEIKRLGFLTDKPFASRTDILKLQAHLQGEIAGKNYDPAILSCASLAAQVLKIMHAQELIESQGVEPLKLYLEDIFKQALTTRTKATLSLAQDPSLRLLHQKIEDAVSIVHPKLIKLKEIVADQLRRKPSAKIIVFNQYRDSIANAVNVLSEVPGVHAKEFVGQAKKKGSGLSQKEQLARIKDFADGGFNVVVMSSVGEEGLDIPEVDLVIFYEPVPSAIRSIQRRGRTGRHAPGDVLILVAKGTRDEAYRWSAFHKERKVQQIISTLDKALPKQTAETITATPFLPPNQRSLDDFGKESIGPENANITIIADFREKTRGIITQLADAGVRIQLERLTHADYLLSPEIGVEFKTAEDFVNSIIDGRLLAQLPALKEAFPSPLLVIQNDQDMFAVRNVHPNAIYGMLATITLSLKIPILFTRSSTETAQLFLQIAKREQQGKSHAYTPVAGKATTLKEQQEALIASLPGVGIVVARNLLARFGSIKGVVEASVDQLTEVDLVGPVKAKKIHEFLAAKYSKE